MLIEKELVSGSIFCSLEIKMNSIYLFLVWTAAIPHWINQLACVEDKCKKKIHNNSFREKICYCYLWCYDMKF